MERPRSFVVRIYRSAPAAPAELAGTVEAVESGERLGFRTAAQLVSILLSRPADEGALAQASASELRPTVYAIDLNRPIPTGEHS